MKQLNYYHSEKILVCPYCGDQKSHSEMGCCGESSSHFETGYLIDDEFHSETDIRIVRPILDVLRYEIFSSYQFKSNLRQLKRRLKTRLCSWYDGQDSTVKRLRVRLGLQWSQLDCIILKQLHDFPLYYTPPKIAEKMRLNALLVSAKLKRGESLTNDDFKI